jgi:hypothetical protein
MTLCFQLQLRCFSRLACTLLSSSHFRVKEHQPGQPGGRGASVHDGGHGSAARAGKNRRTTLKVLMVSCSSANLIRTSNISSIPGVNLSSFPSVAPATNAFNLPVPFGAIDPSGAKLNDVFN